MNQAVVCRKARVDDLNRILAIESQGFRDDAFSRRQLNYLIRHAKGACFVAVLQDVVVGYISVLTRSSGSGRIYSLAVDAGYRGRGIAEQLIDTAIDFMRGENIQAIFLEVAVDNAAAISLYEKKCFVKRSIKRRYYHSGTDAYSMVRALSPCDAAVAGKKKGAGGR